MADIAQPSLREAVARLERFAGELNAYSVGCDDARTWGGPTTYPRNPVDEKVAHRAAADLLMVCTVLHRALVKGEKP